MELDLIDRARTKYQAAVELQSEAGKYFAFHNIAVTYRLQDKAEGEAASVRLLLQAIESHKSALEVRPNYMPSLHGLANALLIRAHRVSGNVRSEHLNEAEAACSRLNELSPGEGEYNLACISALRGDENACHEHLQASQDAGLLPSRKHLLDDADLESVREASWFTEFLDDLDESAEVE